MDKGLVKMKNFATSKNKFGYVYVLTPSSISEKAVITHRFLKRKMDKYENLKSEIEVLQSEANKVDSSGRKTMIQATPVILCSGSGTRLWPL